MQEATKSPLRIKHPIPPSEIRESRMQIDIRELVGPHRQITIKNGEEDYVLRITRNGKLILTK